MPMLSQILIRLSILALCFTAFSASAEWFEVHNIVPTFKNELLNFIKNNWGKLIVVIISFILLHKIYLTSQNK